MSEIITEPVVTEPITQPAPIAQPQDAQTVTVDMEALNKAAELRAERAAQTAVRETLKQQGLDDEAIKGVLAEWKAKQTTPEQELKLRDETIGDLKQQLEAERQEKVALAKGVPLGSEDEATKAKATACITLAKSYVSDDVTFEAALDKAMEIISFAAPAQEKPEAKPPMWGGAGTKSTGVNTLEDYKKMSGQEKIKLKQENPTLYEQFKKALGF